MDATQKKEKRKQRLIKSIVDARIRRHEQKKLKQQREKERAEEEEHLKVTDPDAWAAQKKKRREELDGRVQLKRKRRRDMKLSVLMFDSVSLVSLSVYIDLLIDV